MKRVIILVVGLMLLSTFACGSAERRAQRAERDAHKAQASVHKERLKLVDDYKKCLQDAGEDNAKVEACDKYLRAAEALK